MRKIQKLGRRLVFVKGKIINIRLWGKSYKSWREGNPHGRTSWEANGIQADEYREYCWSWGGRAVKVADHTMILKAHITFTHIPLA